MRLKQEPLCCKRIVRFESDGTRAQPIRCGRLFTSETARKDEDADRRVEQFVMARPEVFPGGIENVRRATIRRYALMEVFFILRNEQMREQQLADRRRAGGISAVQAVALLVSILITWRLYLYPPRN